MSLHRRGRRGNALLEMAIVAVPLFGLLFSIVDFGLAIFIRTTLQHSVREGVLYVARLHYEQDGQREFVHSETGVRTLKAEFDKVAWHNEDHLKQIRFSLRHS